MNSYYCDNIFAVSESKSFLDTVSNINFVMADYQQFINNLEDFFNNQIEDGDLEKFEGEIFELSDADGRVNFPFCIKENKLKFVESDAWRSIILSAILMKGLERNKYEQTQLQHSHLQQF